MIKELIRKEIKWRGREAVQLTNGIVELIMLPAGGHLAAFRFLDLKGPSSQNVLWEAPWPLCDPDDAWSSEKSLVYGAPEAGRFLAGYTGHALCLDYFGDPPPERVAAGLGLHGEAAVTRWKMLDSPEPTSGQCDWVADLPLSRLRFKRKIRLCEGQSVVFVDESLYNQSDAEHHCDWVQHVTFGHPFVSNDASTVIASAQAGVTSSIAYGDQSLLPKQEYFSWPFVRLGNESEVIDLRKPFSSDGEGFLAGVMLDRDRQAEFVLTVNWKLRLGVGYCFRRDDFPWMAIWEENCARQESPWNGTTRARGMEFGTTPLPASVNEGVPDKRVLDAPKGCCVPANGKKTARYLVFLFAVPANVQSIEGVVPEGDTLRIFDAEGKTLLSIPANGCEAFLA